MARVLTVAAQGTAAECQGEGDELAIARVDLDACQSYKRTVFNFAAHRQPQAYGPITERAGVVEPH
jgi:N-carbamoyl-D-amino-acid hydrolase